MTEPRHLDVVVADDSALLASLERVHRRRLELLELLEAAHEYLFDLAEKVPEVADLVAWLNEEFGDPADDMVDEVER